MASLLHWVGKQAKRLEHDITHNNVTDFVGRDVVKPVQHAAGSVVHQAQGAVAQLNTLDGGRTYHTVMDQGAQYSPRPVASVLQQITHNGATNTLPRIPKFAGSVGAGTSLAALRTFEGLGSGIISTPSAAAHLGAFGVEKLTGAHQYSPQTQKLLHGIDTVTHAANAPLSWVENKTDQAAKAYGGPGNAIYKPAQVVGNIATIVPGVVAAAPKAAAVAEKAPEVAKTAKYTYDKLDPAVAELDRQHTQLNQQWQKASPVYRKQIEKAIKANRQARQEATKLAFGNSVKRTNAVNGKNGRNAKLPALQSEQTPALPQGAIGPQRENLPGLRPSASLGNYTTKSTKGVTRSIQNSGEFSPELKAAIQSKPNHSNLAEKALNADNKVKNLDSATADVVETLQKPTRTLTDQDTANAIAVMKAQDAKGNTAAAQQVHDLLAAHAEKGGQFINAFKLISNRTPDGMLFGARRVLKRAGVELDAEGNKQLKLHIDTIKGTKPGTEARDRAVHDMVQFVKTKIPTSAGDKIVNFWRAGLLTSPITTGGNILGNTGEAAVRNFFVNPVATAADKAQSLITGTRTKTLAGGQIKGGAEGAKQGAEYLKTGFDKNNPLDKFEVKGDINYGDSKAGKITSKYVNGVYRGLGAQDKPFREAATRQANIDLAKADAINLKLKGQARADYIKRATTDPNWKPQTFQTANDSKAAGAFAVFGNETALGKVAQIAKQPFEINGMKFDGGVRNFIMPFTQVPASIATRIIHRSDLGATEIVNQILRVRKGLPYDQRAVSEAIGNGTFGIAAVGAGYALSKAGQITGNYPADPKERALWKSEGKQANSVRIGNRWYSLNYIQPFGTLLGIGDQIRQDEKNGVSPSETITNAAARAAKSVESQSFLQGVDGVLSAVNDPQRSAKTYINSTVSSVVPNIVRTTARATDPLQRETNTVKDALQGTIPFLREGLPSKLDMFGKPLKATDNPANQLLNPLRPSIVRNANDKTVKELRRLQDNQNGIIPTNFNKNSITGVKLNDKQARDLNALINPKVKSAWDKIVVDPRYQALSDEDKATALKRAKDQIASAYKRQFAAKNNITAALAKPAKASDVAILTGKTPDFISSSSTSTLSPRDKYQTALDHYKANASTMSDLQKYAAQKSLAKLKIESPFPSDVISLYGMSKANTYNYLTTHKNTKKLADQLVAYDKALYNAGLTKYQKYRNGLAPASGGSRGGRKSGGKSKGAPKTTLKSILAANKAANSATKPIKTASSPHITVKTTTRPSTYKQAALKQYAVAKPTVHRVKRTA